MPDSTPDWTEEVTEGDRICIDLRWYRVDSVDPTKDGVRALYLTPVRTNFDETVRLEPHSEGWALIQVREVDEEGIEHEKIEEGKADA